MCPLVHVEPPTKFDRILIFRGELVGKRGVTFLRGGLQFLMKNKLNLKCLITKTIYKQEMFLSATAMNSNCEILTKILVTFKR